MNFSVPEVNFILSKKKLCSRYSSRPRSVISVAESRASTAKTAHSRKSKVVITTVPNPFCPRVKGMCCLMVLLNLGLILVTLGIVIVIQFLEPIYIWWVCFIDQKTSCNWFSFSFKQGSRYRVSSFWFPHPTRLYCILRHLLPPARSWFPHWPSLDDALSEKHSLRTKYNWLPQAALLHGW